MNEFEEQHVYPFIDIIKQSCTSQIYPIDKLFKYLNWNVEHLEAAAAAAAEAAASQLHSKKPYLQVSSGISSIIEKECVHCKMPMSYTFIRVISTPTVPYNTPLVWYVHFV